jgi:ubiquinone/menaquinone biosynthesis C-methylase UbiE
MDSKGRFSDRVEDYVKYRPHYPKEIISFLQKESSFSVEDIVADIGSGTGISSELFLSYGNTVYAVEPNEEMRVKGEELLKQNPNFISINGTSENTTLQNNSIDLIVAAQAFHWFNPLTTKMEFKRILKRNGKCLLIWNERLVNSGFEKAYEDLLLNFGTDYALIDHRNITIDKIEAFLSKPVRTATFHNFQQFDFAGLKGRLLSSSYVPNRNSEIFPAMISKLQSIFDQHQRNGKVIFNYETKVFFGKI